METKKINKLINSCAQVKLYYFNEEIHCQILKESDSLILVKDIKDWHYDSYMIFPKKYIKKIKYGKTEKCREKILSPLKKEQYIDDIKVIDLTDLKSVLKSLFKTNQGVCIENTREDNYVFIIGKITKIKNKKLKIRTIDLCGNYKKKPKKINYKKITCVFYKDEYSLRLIECAENKRNRVT